MGSLNIQWESDATDPALLTVDLNGAGQVAAVAKIDVQPDTVALAMLKLAPLSARL